MEKTVTLNDERDVVIRDMRAEDVEGSVAFFATLPPEDRRYLRRDVTDREVVEERVRELGTRRVRRLVVEDRGVLVADGALELAGHGLGEGAAEIRLVVAAPYQQKGLGTMLARELFHLAAEAGVEKIVARFMRPQRGARRILRRLGFQDEVLLPEPARDVSGQWQDVIVMRCNLEALWQRMEAFVASTDWRWHR